MNLHWQQTCLTIPLEDSSCHVNLLAAATPFKPGRNCGEGLIDAELLVVIIVQGYLAQVRSPPRQIRVRVERVDVGEGLVAVRRLDYRGPGGVDLLLNREG